MRAQGTTRFPWIPVAVLLGLCIVPVAALLSVGAILGRDCVVERATEGVAGRSMVWRIEQQRCGNGPLVTNVLLAPRGKTLALVASSTGSPQPIGVERADDGVTTLLLEGTGGAGSIGAAIVLPLKSTGRPAKPLVLANGRPKS